MNDTVKQDFYMTFDSKVNPLNRIAIQILQMRMYMVLFVLGCGMAHAQMDTLRVGVAKFGKLTPSKSFSTLFMEKNGKYLPLNVLWIRIVEQIVENGDDLLKVEQQLYAGDSMQNETKVSYLKLKSMLPIKHISQSKATKLVSSFDGHVAELRIDSLKSGVSRSAEIDLKISAYNFEVDEELFSLLPLKKNYKVAIPFYQPGTKKPTKYYTYEVVGEDLIALPNGNSIECWKLESQYTGGMSTWWISVNNQQFIRQKRVRADGSILYKVRLWF